MFMFPEPNPKDYRIRAVGFNIISDELHTPDAFPRCTQTNLGYYSYPIKNTSGEYEIKKVSDVILDRWTQASKAWWIGKPGSDAQVMFEMHQNSKRKEEIDPRFTPKNSIFPRSYQYELDCMEARRQQLVLNKITREEREAQKKNEKQKSPCVCTEVEEVVEEVDDEAQKGTMKHLWHKPPKLFEKTQDDPCKRREEFQKFGQTFKTEACNFYYENFPPPPLSKHLPRFAK